MYTCALVVLFFLLGEDRCSGMSATYSIAYLVRVMGG